jgi:serine/threonine protein kinase
MMSTLPPDLAPTAPHGAGPALEARDALPAGTRLHEFEIRGVLGVGGFGIVYRAWDTALEREVAIKEYLPSSLAARGEGAQVSLRSASDAQTYATGLRSFVNEARLLARFDHPALVQVYRFWEDNHTAYMVMPCYQGRTLQDTRRAMDRPPDEAWLRALVGPLLGALEVLHAQSCYHRDIAPDNILLQPDPAQPSGPGRPVLLDFGAARRVIADRTHDLTAILKPAFAPIEQYAESKHVLQGPWTDLYALGAVLYFCLSGKPPPPATARAVRDDLKPALEVGRVLAEAWPGLRYSPSLLQAIDAALALRPEDRPRTVAQWRALWEGEGIDLELAAPAPPVASGARVCEPSQDWASTLAQDPDEPPRSPPAARARWRWALAGGVLALCVLVGGVWSWRGWLWPVEPVTSSPPPQTVPEAAPHREATAAPATEAAVAAPATAPEPSARRSPATPPAPVRSPPPSSTSSSPVPRPATPTKPAAPQPAAGPSVPSSPREACGRRVLLALWRCLEEQCASERFASHPQCHKVREWAQNKRQEAGW